MSSYTTENGSRANKLVVEMGQLKFCLRDSLALMAKKEKEQKKSDKVDMKKEDEALTGVFDVNVDNEVKDNEYVKAKTIPLKRKAPE